MSMTKSDNSRTHVLSLFSPPIGHESQKDSYDVWVENRLKTLDGAVLLAEAERVAKNLTPLGAWATHCIAVRRQMRADLLQLRKSFHEYIWANVEGAWEASSLERKQRFGVVFRAHPVPPAEIGEATAAPFGWFYGNTSKDVLEYLLQDEPFRINLDDSAGWMTKRRASSQLEKWCFAVF
jgi:hypothetical protein